MSGSQDHGRVTPEVPLTDPEVAAPTHAERVRSLLASQRTGTLGTLTKDGFPYGSFVTFGLLEGDPVFLVSKLAAHTKNLEGDSRASLMVHESLEADPLANSRVTLVGACERVVDDAAEREAFLQVHPGASYYVDFSDFGFFRLRVSQVRYIGGYGRMSWVESVDYAGAEPDPLLAHAKGIIDHMNDDHGDALVAYARAFTRATDASEVVLASVDQYGFDLSVTTEKGPRPARVAFDVAVRDSGAARKAFVALVKQAREKIKAQENTTEG